ncbi:MAG: polyribonucleotide nucleotidyltransferase [Rhodobiaceae bacterium]|nr:polyribonucleotide nucleotidyltransferase [Rhodobiaceae bacterium]|tara:strand:- start:1268 stop:3433 length:2166 start_codon:yes stop_codon:yes gene_type:complete
MFNIHNEEINWGGRTLRIETGKIARQADGAVIVTYGGTSVIATVCAEKKPKTGIDFFPLTVNYQEKSYASGKIPGGYFKREGRPTERETLISRLIDRPIRPLFVKEFKNETQVIATVLTYDHENDPDVVAMIACSAALTISGIPFKGPIGAAKIGLIENELVLNPKVEDIENSKLELVVAGTKNAILMIESEASELTEKMMLEAVMFAHQSMQEVIEMIINLARKCAKDPMIIEEKDNTEITSFIDGEVRSKLEKAFQITDKQERYGQVAVIKDEMIEKLTEKYDDSYDEIEASGVFKDIESSIVRSSILKDSKRIDGRGLSDIRPISVEVGLLPQTHGSSLFTRGETQAIVVTTLGTTDDEQYIDSLDGTKKQNFMLHYNFPPFSVGEVGRIGATGRREIGHGKLAWRAIHPLLPTKDDFPYTIRVVSEITESNGSSSMATVCGTSLALMDAGVPIREPIAGIAMGLILEGKDYAVLSDIIGDEDHLGDMDFKVAGTSKGITTLQMDIKISGITKEIMKKALDQAKAGRKHILSEMEKAIKVSRNDVADTAPRIETMNIPTDKIKDVIGSGGKVIKEMVEQTGAKISVDDSGIITIASTDKNAIESAKVRIHQIVDEPEVGEIYKGKVVKIVDFGAFVNFFGPRDGLVHISQLSNERTSQVTDVINENDDVYVKLIGFDDRGKSKLSMKNINQDSGLEESESNASNDKPEKTRQRRKKKD